MQLNTLPTFLGSYRALVTSVADPTLTGRIRTQCPQISGSAELNWALPTNPHAPIPAVGSIVWIAFNGGDLTKPVYFPNHAYAYLDPGGTSVDITSLTNNSLNDATNLFVVSGADGAALGTSSSPHVTIRDANGTTPVDFHLSGAVVKVDNSGAFLNWTNPSGFGTGWANGTGFGGSYPTLRWRYDAEDNIHVMGVFHATSTTPGSIIATGFPATIGSNVSVGSAAIGLNIANGAFGIYINSSGELHATTTGTLVVNNTYAINTKIPIGNLN